MEARLGRQNKKEFGKHWQMESEKRQKICLICAC